MGPGVWNILMGVRSVFAICAEVRLYIAVDPPCPDTPARSPLDQLDPAHHFDAWEYVLYIMTLSFLAEGKHAPNGSVTSFADHTQRVSRFSRWARSISISSEC